MIIGVPTETKALERRVGLLPASVRELISAGHDVVVQAGAGAGVGASDAHYQAAGGSVVATAGEVFERAGLIVKVKEPQRDERKMLHPGQVLFTFLHLAADREQTVDLIESGATCIAYETVTDDRGRLPLLAPMSCIAGRMAVQAAAIALQAGGGGAGILLGGVAGVRPARVTVIGGGVVGTNATDVAVGMGADVTVLDRNLDVLSGIAARFGPAVKTVYATAEATERAVLDADAVVGAVLVRGAIAPRLVSSAVVAEMRAGSVLVDVAIDQGGAFETSRPTTHDAPTFLVDDVVHYCVSNMPGAVPRTASAALNHATLSYVMELAADPHGAVRSNAHLQNGLNVVGGLVTDRSVAAAHGIEWTDPRAILSCG